MLLPLTTVGGCSQESTVESLICKLNINILILYIYVNIYIYACCVSINKTCSMCVCIYLHKSMKGFEEPKAWTDAYSQSEMNN